MLDRGPGAEAGAQTDASRSAFQVAVVSPLEASDQHGATHPMATRLQAALAAAHDVTSYIVTPSLRAHPLRLADFVFVCADPADRYGALAFADNLRGPRTVVVVLDRPRPGRESVVLAGRTVLKAVLDAHGPGTRIVAPPSRATASLYELLRSTAIDLVVAPEFAQRADTSR